jgi:signal transduction histidine kinase
MKRAANKSSLLLYGATILMLVVAVALLLLLLRRFELDIQANVQGLQRMLSNEALLRDRYDPYVRFGPIEDLVSKYAEHPYLREMTITKFFRDKEDVVYPFYMPALLAAESGTSLPKLLKNHPRPDQPAPDVIKAPLVARGRLLGHLYVRIDRRPLQAVQLAVGSLTILILAFVGVYVAQFRRQEETITRTTIELEEKRKEIIRLERLALAGQLTASLLHDVKKPVLNIKNELEDMLASADSLPPAHRSTLEMLRDQAQLFFAILRSTNIERFVRGEGEPEYVDVNELIHASLALVRYERGQVANVLNLAESLPPVLAQPVHLVQVFSNIILNAYQAMEGKGTLTIGSKWEGQTILIDFTDTGPGIPPEEIDKIFAPFYTTKPEGKGTGLGLYISRDIVRQLGGDIHVFSSKQGTTFRVEIPVSRNEN